MTYHERVLHNSYLLTLLCAKFVSLSVTDFTICTAKKDKFRSTNCFAKLCKKEGSLLFCGIFSFVFGGQFPIKLISTKQP